MYRLIDVYMCREAVVILWFDLPAEDSPSKMSASSHEDDPQSGLGERGDRGNILLQRREGEGAETKLCNQLLHKHRSGFPHFPTRQDRSVDRVHSLVIS